MQNIDPLYFLTPIVVIAFSFGLVAYWRYRKRFSGLVLLFSLIAYAGAILIKTVLQYLTFPQFIPAMGGNSLYLGLYYGLQTMIFEVGGAFAVAWYAVKQGKMRSDDAEGYGLGLAMWENGVLIGGSLLLNYIIYFVTLSSGSGAAAQQLFDILDKNAPSLFYPPSTAMPLIGLAILERVSSLLLHFSWGFLVLLSVIYRKKLFFLFALPMGLVDSLVPFANSIGIMRFEILILVLGLISLAVAITLARKVRADPTSSSLLSSSEKQNISIINSHYLFSVAFRRSVNFGKLYLFIGIGLSFFIGRSAQIGSSATASVAANLYPLVLPICAIFGAVGALQIFVSDKSKGVYEYLIAYGVNTSTIFRSIVLATVGLVSIVFTISIVGTVAIMLIFGEPVTPTFLELLLIYTIPLGYAASIFMSMAGMVWSFLTTRISGINSPIGFAPLIGLTPVMIVLFLSGSVGPENFIPLVATTTIILFTLVGVMMVVSSKKMVRERFLSNA